MRIGYWLESQKERDRQEDQDEGGWTILKWIGWDGRDWIGLAQDRDQLRALVNTVMNLGFLKIAGNFLNGCKMGSFSGRAQLRK
jgi:hypothetical protein